MTHGSTFLWILGSCGEIFYDLFIRVISMLVSSLTLPFVVGPSHMEEGIATHSNSCLENHIEKPGRLLQGGHRRVGNDLATRQ